MESWIHIQYVHTFKESQNVPIAMDTDPEKSEK
jgi:hypothetical protein